MGNSTKNIADAVREFVTRDMSQTTYEAMLTPDGARASTMRDEYEGWVSAKFGSKSGFHVGYGGFFKALGRNSDIVYQFSSESGVRATANALLIAIRDGAPDPKASPRRKRLTRPTRPSNLNPQLEDAIRSFLTDMGDAEYAQLCSVDGVFGAKLYDGFLQWQMARGEGKRVTHKNHSAGNAFFKCDGLLTHVRHEKTNHWIPAKFFAGPELAKIRAAKSTTTPAPDKPSPHPLWPLGSKANSCLSSPGVDLLPSDVSNFVQAFARTKFGHAAMESRPPRPPAA